MWISELDLSYWRFATLCVSALSCALWGHAAWSVPALPRAVLGERGRQRERWLRRGTGNVLLEPLLRRVGAWVQRLLGPATAARIERALQLAGYPAGVSEAEWVAASLLAGLAGVLSCVLYAHYLGFAVWLLPVPVLSLALPAWEVKQARGRRVLALERSLPIAMDLVALCVRAGGDFPSALRFVVAEISDAHAVCRHELGQLQESLAVGRTREQALAALAERVDSPAVRDFVMALVQSERRGVPLSEALASQAESLRRVRSVRAEEMAAKAGVRMVLPLMLMLGSIVTLLVGPLALQGVAL